MIEKKKSIIYFILEFAAGESRSRERTGLCYAI
jgi:hypothetical protein